MDPIRTFPAPIAYFPLVNLAYEATYDARTRNPQVVCAEVLPLPPQRERVSRRGMRFQEDPRIPEIVRSRLVDYRGSGQDRGHLEPAGNHSHSKKAMAETFRLTNVVPQNPNLNRGFWRRLEKHIRDLRENATVANLHVCTGALYLPLKGTQTVRYEVIGPDNVAVPTHLYKIISIRWKNGNTRREAFVVPNKEIPFTTRLKAFRTTIEQVEKLSGSLYTQAASMPESFYEFEKKARDGIEFGAYDSSRHSIHYVCRYVSRQSSLVNHAFERYIDTLRSQNKTVRECKGPIYFPYTAKNGRKYVRYEIDKNGRAIPTHMYRVLTIEDRALKVRQEAYIFPVNSEPAEPLASYMRTVDEVARLSGVLFPLEVSR